MNVSFYVLISLADQALSLMSPHQIIQQYPISSGANGAGEERGSGKTPRGWHIIRAKIGQAADLNTVFVGRRPTGERYSPALSAQYPGRDWILTRILWLSGLESGKNRLGVLDTMQRYIYIHGTPDEASIGTPGSRGCIRMRNTDIIPFFNAVPAGTRVLISEGSMIDAQRLAQKGFP
jgi:lipoprotein-anchoring transpeptidase ErfK/SrfK